MFGSYRSGSCSRRSRSSFSAACSRADRRGPVVVISYAVVALWILRTAQLNRTRVRIAAVILGAGWLLNLAVIAPNGGMPVSRDAMERAGLPRNFEIVEGNLFKHTVLDDSTRLSFLADVVPIRYPLPNVYSVGDFVLLVGIASFLAFGMIRTPNPVRAGAGHTRVAI